MVAQSHDKAVQAEAVSAESLHYSLIVEWDPRDNIYVVTVPELPGCRTHGATYVEAIAMAQEAIECWVTGALEDGWVLPTPRHFTDDDLSADNFIAASPTR